MRPSPAPSICRVSIRWSARVVGLMVVLFILTAGFAACGSGDVDEGSEANVSTDESADDDAGTPSDDDADDAGAPSDNAPDNAPDNVPDEVLVDEAAARQALNSLIAAMAAADYPTAATHLINEGISDVVLVQLRMTEDEALRPGGLDVPLAGYCAVNNCTAEVRVGDMVEAEFLSAVFEVRVDIDGETTAINVPVGAFEGQYTVGLLPFGLIPPEAVTVDEGNSGTRRTTTTNNNAANNNADDGDAAAAPVVDDRYPGADSAQGWRVAPVATSDDPVVTFWNRNGWMFPNHTGWPADALPITPEIAPLSQVVNAASVILYQREGDSETIWLHHPDEPDEKLVTVPEGQFVDLVGARVVDLDESVIFYTIRSGTTPENTRELLHSMDLSDGAAREIVTTGGWESGTRFALLDDAYPEVVGTWGAEGYLGQVILDLESGEVVYEADAAGYSCFDGEPDCPAYDTAALFNDRIYGIRSEWDAVREVVHTRSLFSFDPESGREEVVARFAWDNGLWYPRQIMAYDNELIVSVEDGNGVALPAVVVDPITGDARTMQRAGFVGPAYLS